MMGHVLTVGDIVAISAIAVAVVLLVLGIFLFLSWLASGWDH